jgi:hypothetical protein
VEASPQKIFDECPYRLALMQHKEQPLPHLSCLERARVLLVCIMDTVRIGRRLVLVLLLAMTPVVAIYTYWSAQWSSRNYIGDPKRETSATTRALAPVVAGYIKRGQWPQVHEMLRRMSADETEGAVLQPNGKLWYAVDALPRDLIITGAHGIRGTDGYNFEESVGDRYWFCRIVPLDNEANLGYLLVAQDWSDIDEDVRQRMPPVGAALLVTASSLP